MLEDHIKEDQNNPETQMNHLILNTDAFIFPQPPDYVMDLLIIDTIP